MDCSICAERRPRDLLVELAASWVTAPPAAPLPGYVCVVARTHVVEPFELPPDERAAFWEDCLAAAAGLAKLLQPRKLNYEIHGNTVPHLHMHLYPRDDSDPFEGGPIDPRRASFRRSSDELERMRAAIAAAR